MASVFLISPASCSGLRAHMIMRPGAGSLLARRLREPLGVPLGEVYTFLSGLYFRGKLAYARAFASRPEHVLVITPTAGLRVPETSVTLDVLQGFARIDIANGGVRFRRPLLADARALAAGLAADDEVILLGSIASSKYVDVLSGVFGSRLKFPIAFVGRGDMSRGGLLLRCVTAGTALDYVPVAGTTRRGTRPPKLPPLPRRVVRASE
jgi:hypothetical protein